MDAMCQDLARRNQKLEQHRVLLLIVLGVVTVLGLLTNMPGFHNSVHQILRSAPNILNLWSVPVVATSGETTTLAVSRSRIESVTPQAVDAAITPTKPTVDATTPSGVFNTPTPPVVTQQGPGQQELLDVLRALIEQKQAPNTQQAAKPIVLVPAIKAEKPISAPASAKVRTEVDPSERPAQALPALWVIDFFGNNTAVQLSSDGGHSVRTYRMGDSLPTGEVITGIDTQGGTVSTNQRTIKKDVR